MTVRHCTCNLSTAWGALSIHVTSWKHAQACTSIVRAWWSYCCWNFKKGKWTWDNLLQQLLSITIINKQLPQTTHVLYMRITTCTSIHTCIDSRNILMWESVSLIESYSKCSSFDSHKLRQYESSWRLYNQKIFSPSLGAHSF